MKTKHELKWMQKLFEKRWLPKGQALDPEDEIMQQGIAALVKDGYIIEEDCDGYRLVVIPDTKRSRAFISGLKTEQIGQHAIFYEEVTSTQDIARQLILRGVPDGTLIVSDRQTKGRGRLERKWHSQSRKGIWASFVIRPDLPAHKLPQFTLLTAVAICQALEEVTGIVPEIKWPNDILVKGKKLCGILTELVQIKGETPALIIGFGINVRHRHEDFPPELAEKATSLLLITEKDWEHHALLQTICARFEKLYRLLVTDGFSPIKTLWESYCGSLGKTITAQTLTGTYTGEVLGIDHEGVLLIKLADGRIERLYSADIIS